MDHQLNPQQTIQRSSPRIHHHINPPIQPTQPINKRIYNELINTALQQIIHPRLRNPKHQES